MNSKTHLWCISGFVLKTGCYTQSAPVERNVLLQENQLKLWGDREKNIYKKQKTQDFILILAYDRALLQATGMTAKFELIFKTVGCEGAGEIDEPRCKLLTIEFLCTLQPHRFGSFI